MNGLFYVVSNAVQYVFTDPQRMDYFTLCLAFCIICMCVCVCVCVCVRMYVFLHVYEHLYARIFCSSFGMVIYTQVHGCYFQMSIICYYFQMSEDKP